MDELEALITDIHAPMADPQWSKPIPSTGTHNNSDLTVGSSRDRSQSDIFFEQFIQDLKS